MRFATGRGSWPAFWFWGNSRADDPQYNTGYASEIDIAEYNWSKDPWPSSGYSVSTDHVFHWWWPENIYGTKQMDIPGGIKENSVNWNTSHTFKLIYTPYDIKFFIDGALNWRRSRFYTYVSLPPDFEVYPVDIFYEDIDESTTYWEYVWYPKHEGHIILSQQVAGNVDNGDISAPQTSLFEWVMYKGLFLAPEITLSTQAICTSGTATMDVATEATNITWQLSPSNLFSTTSGNGKVATITRASGANGKGKITYSFQMPSGETFTAEKEILVGTRVPGTIFIQMDAPPRRFTATIDDVPTATSYNWYLDGVLNTTYHGTSAIFNRKSPFCGKWYGVSVEAINNCGTSARTSGLAVEPGCFFLLLLSPNPTGSETTVELVSENGEVIDPYVSWELEVYDPGQQLKVKQAGVKGKSAKLNTSGWKDGVYIVRATYNGNVLTDRLIVKR